MKTTINKKTSALSGVALFKTLVVLAIIALVMLVGRPPKAHSQALATSSVSINQASTVVTPRTWTVFSGLQLSNGQTSALTTITNTNGISALLGTNDPNNQVPFLTNPPVSVIVPTFLPPTGSKAMSLTLIINNTNNFQGHPSNIVVTAYAAYDTLGVGSTASISQSRYGLLFGSNALFTWTIPVLTNGLWNTNIPLTQWEPSTAIGFTIADNATPTASGPVSNIWATLLATVTP